MNLAKLTDTDTDLVFYILEICMVEESVFEATMKSFTDIGVRIFCCTFLSNIICHMNMSMEFGKTPGLLYGRDFLKFLNQESCSEGNISKLQ